MCGTHAPAIELLQALSAVPDTSTGADNEAGVSSSDSQQKPSKPGRRRLIPIVVVSIALMVFASFFYEVRKGKLLNESGPAAEPTRPLQQPKQEGAGPRHIVPSSARAVQHLVATTPGTAQATDSAAKEDDPAELWNAVKRGSVGAEVALANLYLKGEAVPQNCEQAHMLLLAASMKGSKFAETVLRSSYAERCH